MRVETRIALLSEEHLINETVKFSMALFRMRNWLSLRMFVSPWAVKKCYRSRDFYVQQYFDVGVDREGKLKIKQNVGIVMQQSIKI